jgi:hypothetical protein
VTCYSNLKDAVLDLDPLLLRTLAAFSIDEGDEGHLVTFRFMLYGQHFERPSDVDQCPDKTVLLDSNLDLQREIADLHDCEILGSLNAARLAPGLGDAPARSHRWVVKTHSGSQGERIEWRNSIY